MVVLGQALLQATAHQTSCSTCKSGHYMYSSTCYSLSEGHILYNAGSGYLTGCFGIMVGDSGQVLGVEKHKELALRSMESLEQAVPALMKKGTIKIMPGNVLGKVLGEYGPFDAIHVGAAAATMPQVPRLHADSALHTDSCTFPQQPVTVGSCSSHNRDICNHNSHEIPT